MPEPIFMKLGMYILPPEPMSTAYFIYPSHLSVCLYMYPLLLLGNGSVISYRGNEYTCNNIQFFGRVVSYAVRVLSKENRRLVLLRTSYNTVLSFHLCPSNENDIFSSGVTAMEHSLFWEASTSSILQEFIRILRNPNVHYRVHKSPPLVPGHMNPVHTLSSYSFQIHFNITLTSKPRPYKLSLSFTISYQYLVCISPLPWVLHALSISSSLI
jgi:hypothetical protein